MPRRPPPVSRSERSEVPAPPPQEFGTVPDPAYLREFPVAHRAAKPVEFWPARPERIEGQVLEIGPGRGDFLLTAAQANPGQFFVAVELGRKRYLRLIRRIEKRQLRNVLLILGDARLVLPKYVHAESFASIVVLFPDPWPKRRHAFHRLLQPEFLTELARVLKPNGHVYLKSDVESYISWVAEQLRRIPQLRIVEDRWPWGPLQEQEGKTLSLFADRQTGFGYTVHSLCLERVV